MYFGYGRNDGNETKKETTPTTRLQYWVGSQG